MAQEQNPIDAALASSSATASPANPVDTALSRPAATDNPVDRAFVSSNPVDATLDGQLPEKHQTPDKDTPWYERAWDWANTPLVNFNKENQGGFIGGTEDVASGLTSPLSIGLTAATLGVGPLLRGLGLAAEELPVAVRGLRALVDAGFTAQGAIQAAKESPRVLDALKDGDYDTAKRLAVHVFAGGAFTYLGGKHLVSDAAPVVNPYLEKFGFKIRPSDANIAARKNESIRERDIEAWSKRAEGVKEEFGKQFEKLTPNEREGVMYLMQAGLDKKTLIQRHNMLAEAAGKLESRVPDPETGSPETGQKIKLGSPTVKAGTPAGIGEVQTYPISVDGKQVGVADVVIGENGDAHITWLGAEHDVPTGPLGRGKLSNIVGWAGLRELARQFKEQNPQIKTISGMRIGGLGGRGGDVLAPREFPIDKLVGSEDEAAATKSVPEAGAPSAEKLARYKELVGQQNLKQKYTPEEVDKLLSAYKSAINSTPEMQQMAAQVRDLFSDIHEFGNKHEVLGDAIDNYVTQLWEAEKDNPAVNNLLREARSGNFFTNVLMARHRMFENAFEGQLLGRKLKITDPVSLVANQLQAVGRAVANRDFLDRLKSGRMPDGRPMAAVSGVGHLIGEESEHPAVLTDPNRIRDIRISAEETESLKQSGMLDKFLADGTIKQISYGGNEPLYAWDTQAYRDIDHSSFSNWNYGAHGPDGTPALIKGDLRVHPEAYDYIKNIISPEKPGPIEGALLKVGGQAKHLMLSLSPFHVAQEGLRALMTGVNPWGVEKWSAEDPLVNLGVEESLTLGSSKRAKQLMQEGVHGAAESKLIRSIPILRDIQGHLQTFLFDKYIPGLKVRAFRSLYDRYSNILDDPKKLSNLLEDRKDLAGYDKARAAARLAAEDTNERFGGLNYEQLGRMAKTQDFLRLATLAPDWLESEMRFMKRVFTGGAEGQLARTDFVKMTAAMWAASRVLNMLITGKPHPEAPFGVATVGPDGKEKVYSIRTLPTDMMHAISDPYDFVRGRLSPLGRIGVEAYTGRDYAGRKQTPFHTVVDIARGIAPIPAQLIGAGVTGQQPDLSTPDQIAKGAGLTAQVYKTQAQQKAAQLASEKSESGPVDAAQLRKHQATMEWEDRIRAGSMPITDLHNMVVNGDLSVKDAKNIISNVKETQGLDPQMARLYSRAQRLPMRDFLAVWDTATNDEKVALSKLLIKKKSAYFKKAAKDFTPEERQNDAVFKRLRSLFPQAEPW